MNLNMQRRLLLLNISVVVILLVIVTGHLLYGESGNGEQQSHSLMIRRTLTTSRYGSIGNNEDDEDKLDQKFLNADVSRNEVVNSDETFEGAQSDVSDGLECPTYDGSSLLSYLHDSGKRLVNFILGIGSYQKSSYKSNITKVQLDFRSMADPKHNRSEELVVVMAASSNHYQSIAGTAGQLRRFHAKQKIIIYDIGLEQDEANEIQKWCGVEYRQFNFESYPQWMDVYQSHRGQYAWKPMILYEVSKQYNNFIWLDGDVLVVRDLGVVKQQLQSQGFASSQTVGTVRQWTHPGTIQYLFRKSKQFNLKSQASALRLKQILPLANANGATNAFNLTNTRARQLFQDWIRCSSEKQCIAPCGSSRKNHRQDQAVLTVLVHIYGIKLLDKGALGLFPHRPSPLTIEECKQILMQGCKISPAQ
ncbi:hypothetical protein MIR68_006947 [Amoeboaphelidium protococcarum]|nr:hypothetical protein MIR68_006947 [Amoeboaphelidium protococcarum]